MRWWGRYGYPVLTRWVRRDDVLYLGPGYEEEPPMALPLSTTDEPDRFPIQLYHRLANETDLSGKHVLEVSCGHGGGASYLMRTFNPASYTGLDLNPAGIAFCRKRYNLPGLEFVQGDAENLPFPDESFDVVINIEASHCYPNFSRFLAEVARVLRPGGRFLYTDLRIRDHVEDWQAALSAAPMQMINREVINDQIIRGYEKNSQQRETQLNRHLPGFLGRFAADFAGVQGSGNYRALQTGELSYQRYTFAKEPMTDESEGTQPNTPSL